MEPLPPTAKAAAAGPDGAVLDATGVPEDVAPDTGGPIGRARVIRFSAGFLAFSLLWTTGLLIIAIVLLPQRLTDIGVAQPAALFGTINALGAISSLVANLLFGNFSDRTRSRLGRRTPWIVGGAVVAGVALGLVGVLQSIVLLIISYCVSLVGLNMMIAPAVAVLSDRVPKRVRGTASAFYGAGNVAGASIGTLVGAAFLTDPLPGFLVAGVLMFLSGVVAVALWPRETSAADLAPAAGGLTELALSFRPPRHAPDFYKAFVGRLLMLISYQMVSAYQLYIVQNYLGQSTAESARTIATMSVITLVVSLVTSIGAGPLSDRIRRRKVPVVAASLLFAVGIAMPWVFPSTTGMYLYAAVAGAGWGIYGSVDQALNVDVLPDKETAGKDLGILNLATTAGQTAGPIITSALVVAAGGYSAVFPVAITAAVLGALVIVWIKGIR